MKKCIYLAIAVLVVSCKTVRVNEENFAWKSFDNENFDQSIDLRQYASPNIRDGQDPGKVVILCASGGGARAAAFTVGILLELEKILYPDDEGKLDSSRNALNEIDYFSTVSGGGWGASSYIAYRYQKQIYSSPKYQKLISDFNDSITLVNPSSDEIIEDFRHYNHYEKFLANRADFRYFKYQIPYLFLFGNGAVRSDRVMTNRLNAGYLGWSYRNNVECKIQRCLNTSQKKCAHADPITLGDVFKAPGEKPFLPFLIANTTNIDNYMLVPFTPDRLSHWGVTAFRYYLKSNSRSNNPGFTDLDSVHGSGYDYRPIPLASATKASSGIPFLVSSATYPALKDSISYFLHLQDGGIIDQQAMHSAKAILRYHKPEISDKKNRLVFIVDASGSGIQNKKQFKEPNVSRFYNASRVMAPFTTPNAQYGLTRERIKLFEDEYDCTVVYLGTEVLLDPGIKSKASGSRKLPVRKKAIEKDFYDRYRKVQQDRQGFLSFSLEERKLLYTYISKYVPTSFVSKGSRFKGRYLDDNPEGTSNIMFLAGRGVVQLKRDEISAALNK